MRERDPGRIGEKRGERSISISLEPLERRRRRKSVDDCVLYVLYALYITNINRGVSGSQLMVDNCCILNT